MYWQRSVSAAVKLEFCPLKWPMNIVVNFSRSEASFQPEIGKMSSAKGASVDVLGNTAIRGTSAFY